MWTRAPQKADPTPEGDRPVSLNAAMTYLQQAVNAANRTARSGAVPEISDVLETARTLDALRDNTHAVDRITRLAVDCFYGDVSLSICSAFLARDFVENRRQLQVLTHRRAG